LYLAISHSCTVVLVTLLCLTYRYTACRLFYVFFSGENVYIGLIVPIINLDNVNPLILYGVITPSQQLITYCDYNSNEKELTLNTSERYHTLIGTDPRIICYWTSSEGYTEKDTNYFPEGAVISDDKGRKDKPYLLFPARVEASVIKESKVVGYYEKSKFPADLDGLHFGFGQAWYDEDATPQGRTTPIKT